MLKFNFIIDYIIFFIVYKYLFIFDVNKLIMVYLIEIFIFKKKIKNNYL